VDATWSHASGNEVVPSSWQTTVARHLEITESTWHRWRNQYGGMKADDAKELKELHRENTRLKKIVADQALDIEMLKELNRKKW
jgi:putative transposase